MNSDTEELLRIMDLVRHAQDRIEELPPSIHASKMSGLIEDLRFGIPMKKRFSLISGPSASDHAIKEKLFFIGMLRTIINRWESGEQPYLGTASLSEEARMLKEANKRVLAEQAELDSFADLRASGGLVGAP